MELATNETLNEQFYDLIAEEIEHHCQHDSDSRMTTARSKQVAIANDDSHGDTHHAVVSWSPRRDNIVMPPKSPTPVEMEHVQKVDLKKVDSAAVSMHDLESELKSRNIAPKGFFADDVEQLQKAYDQEHAEYQNRLEEEARETQASEQVQKVEQRRHKYLKRQRDEEIKALTGSPTLARHLMWIQKSSISTGGKTHEQEHIEHPAEPPLPGKKITEHASNQLNVPRIQKEICLHLEVNNVTGRLLAKALWGAKASIIEVNVARMNLSDVTGSYVARALSHNSSVRKLDLSENLLSRRTCAALAGSLKINSVLQCLVLDSNPLTMSVSNDDDNRSACCSCEEVTLSALTGIVGSSKTLMYLSLWRCSLGPEIGADLADAIEHNPVLRELECRFNHFHPEDCRRITKQLDENHTRHHQKMWEEQERQAAWQQEQEVKQQQEEEQRKLKRRERWFKEQIDNRAQERASDEQFETEQRQEEKKAQQRETEEVRRREYARAALEAAGKKKKKSGAKKKGAASSSGAARKTIKDDEHRAAI
jgi:hypothetical protein